MKILVIGSTSVIGRAVAKRLADQGAVKTAGRNEADIVLDLMEWNSQPCTSESFDVVIHVAADFGGTTDEDFRRAELVNSVGTLSACALAHRVKAKHFILMSSISSFFQAGDPYFGIYALSKRHSEEMAQFACNQYNIALTVLRPSQVYDAAGDCRRHQAFFYLIADRAQAGQDIEIFGSHDARRNYLFLDDLSEIVSRVVERRTVGSFNCSYPRDVRISELAEAAYAAFGTRGRLQFRPAMPDLFDLPITQDDQLYDQIEFIPRCNINEGYKRVKQHLENVH